MQDVPEVIEVVWKIESTRRAAASARVTHDIGIAEELAQDAQVTALDLRPEEGIPDNSGAWLMTATNRRAIDWTILAFGSLMRRIERRRDSAWRALPNERCSSQAIEDWSLRSLYIFARS